MCLTETQTYFATPRPYVDEIHPLVSQPVLECCLQIPTYILSHGGTDRTIARAAFRNALPPEIAERSSKGAVNQFFYDAIYGNREHIRPFLLDGLLADRGLLDRFELERSPRRSVNYRTRATPHTYYDCDNLRDVASDRDIFRALDRSLWRLREHSSRPVA